MRSDYICTCGAVFLFTNRYKLPINPMCPACNKCTTLRIWECNFKINGYSYKNGYSVKNT